MSLPNTREDESQIAWRTVPTPCLNQMSLPLPSWLINSFHGIQVSALYVFFSWGFVPASKLECILHSCISVIFLSKVIFYLPSGPDWLKGIAIVFLARAICHL